jgi:hypothetical protein
VIEGWLPHLLAAADANSRRWATGPYGKGYPRG